MSEHTTEHKKHVETYYVHITKHVITLKLIEQQTNIEESVIFNLKCKT